MTERIGRCVVAVESALGDVYPVERVVVPNRSFGEFVTGVNME
jgi:hypothetical protein